MTDYIYTTDKENILIETSTQSLRDRIVDELVAQRKNRGYTQQDIADMTKLPRANISRLERKLHIPSLELLIKYADCLGLKLDFSLIDKNNDEKGAPTH